MEIEPLMFTNYFGNKNKPLERKSRKDSKTLRKKSKQRKRHEQPQQASKTSNNQQQTTENGVTTKSTKEHTNGPTNEATNQPVSEPVNQHVNQPINEPTNQPANQPINEPTNGTTNDSNLKETPQLNGEESVKEDSHDSVEIDSAVGTGLNPPNVISRPSEIPEQTEGSSHRVSFPTHRLETVTMEITELEHLQELVKSEVPGRIPFDLVGLCVLFFFIVLAVRPYVGFLASHLCGWIVVILLWVWSQMTMLSSGYERRRI